MDKLENAIRGLEIERECVSRECDRQCEKCDLVQNREWLIGVFDDAIAMLKSRVPMVPKHIHEEYPEHDWYRDKNGEIDMFVLDFGIHNGPGCKRCHESFCKHCVNDWRNKGPCVIDEYRCPVCDGYLVENRKYCDNCGQALKWK